MHRNPAYDFTQIETNLNVIAPPTRLADELMDSLAHEIKVTTIGWVIGSVIGLAIRKKITGSIW